MNHQNFWNFWCFQSFNRFKMSNRSKIIYFHVVLFLQKWWSRMILVQSVSVINILLKDFNLPRESTILDYTYGRFVACYVVWNHPHFVKLLYIKAYNIELCSKSSFLGFKILHFWKTSSRLKIRDLGDRPPCLCYGDVMT